MTSVYVNDGPLGEAAGRQAVVCAEPGVEAHATIMGLKAYAGWLQSRHPGLLVAIRYIMQDGVTRVVTEVHAEGNSKVLLPVYDAEIVAHQAARREGGTASFIFQVFDLDDGEQGPNGQTYEHLI